MSIRFENSAKERCGIDAFEFDDLGRARETADDPDRRRCYPRKLRKKAHNRFVGFAIHGRRGNLQLPDIFASAVRILSGEFGPARARSHSKRESRFHSSLFFATEF
jgi:hypothetical protein